MTNGRKAIRMLKKYGIYLSYDQPLCAVKQSYAAEIIDKEFASLVKKTDDCDELICVLQRIKMRLCGDPKDDYTVTHATRDDVAQVANIVHDALRRFGGAQ